MSADATWRDVLEGRARWCVVEGDCLDTLADMRGEVDHVISDPPFEAEAHTNQRRQIGKQGTERNAYTERGGGRIESAPLSFAAITSDEREAVAAEMARLARRWVIVFSQVEAVMEWQRVLTLDGSLSPRRIGVWVKPDAMPQFSGDRPGMGYESIVFAHRKGRSTWNGGGKHGVFTHSCHRDPLNNAEHQTQKPVPLMLELVELFTDPDEVVLDPFAGSGTTGVACLRLGRRFIGIEKSEVYAKVARERLAAESQGLTLRDARAGQLSLLGGDTGSAKR